MAAENEEKDNPGGWKAWSGDSWGTQRDFRVIGDKKHKKLLGSSCQGAMYMLRSWHLMFLLVVEPGIGSQ